MEAGLRPIIAVVALFIVRVRLAAADDPAGPARLVAQLGHVNHVAGVAIAPDKRFVATAGQDGCLRLWHTETGLLVRSFAGHAGPVSEVAFSPDGNLLLSGSWDGTARLWQVATGDELRQFPNPSHVQAIAFSPDGRQVLTGDRSGIARLWNASSGKCLRSIELGPSEMVWSVEFAPAARELLVGDNAGIVRILDVQGREKRRFTGHSGHGVYSIQISADRRSVLTGGRDTARIWTLASCKEIAYLKNRESVSSPVFLNGDRRVATAGGGGLTSWNALTGEEDRRYEVPDCDYVIDLKRSLDGAWLAFGSGRSLRSSLTGIPFAPGSEATIWDVALEREIVRLRGAGQWAAGAAFAPDDTALVVLGGGRIFAWSLATGHPIAHGITRTKVSSLAFSPDGCSLVTGGPDGIATIWDWPSGTMIGTLNCGQSIVDCVGSFADGRRIVTGCLDGMNRHISVWDATDGRLLSTIDAPSHSRAMALASDGSWIVTGGPREGALWNAETGEMIRRFPLQSREQLTGFAFSYDSKFVAGSTHISYIPMQRATMAYIWEVGTGKLLRTLGPHHGALNGVAFSPDGKVVATAGSDGVTHLWDAKTGARMGRLAGHDGMAHSVAFRRDGRHVVTAGTDGTVRLWDASSGVLLCAVVIYEDGGWAVLGPENRFDASNDGNVSGLHWIEAGAPVPLAKYRDRAYEPGLLARVIGLRKIASTGSK